MLSREVTDPGPGPSSVTNCSQNLWRDRAAVSTSLPVNGWVASDWSDARKTLSCLKNKKNKKTKHHRGLAAQGVHCVLYDGSDCAVKNCSLSLLAETKEPGSTADGDEMLWFFFLFQIQNFDARNNLGRDGYATMAWGIHLKALK